MVIEYGSGAGLKPAVTRSQAQMEIEEMIDRRADLRAWIERTSKKGARYIYGRQMATGESKSKLLQDYKGMIESLAAEASRSLAGHEILAAVTDSQLPNAWAFRNAFNDPRTSVVLVTKELVRRIQSISTGASKATLDCLNSKDCQVDLSKFWGDLPKDNKHANVLGRLLGTMTIAFIMSHEFAHIIFGHGFSRLGSADELNGAYRIDELVDLTAPALGGCTYTAVASAFAVDGRIDATASDRSQCYEMDADVHAMLWTKEHIRRFEYNSLSSKVFSEEERRVVQTVLGNPESARFLLCVVPWTMLYALGASSLDMSRLSEGTHPQVGMRLALMIYTEHRLESLRRHDVAPPIYASQYAALVIHRSFDGIASPDYIFDMIGARTAFANLEAIAKREAYLAAIRRSREIELRKYRLETSFPCVTW